MLPYHIEGANDNNSSTAVLLGVAEALAKSEKRPKRSVVIMSVDGEESGLTGSSYYVANPILPKEQVKAIINLEQVGAGEAFGAGFNYLYPELEETAKQANDQYTQRPLYTRENRFQTRPRTDGAVFMKAGYPCMDIRAVGGGFYHHPKDNITSINPETLKAASDWLYWMSIQLADQ